MKRIIVASRNQHKIDEIKEITKKYGYDVVSRDEAKVPKIEIVEDGETFEENSLKKAEEIGKLTGEIIVADDSGLMVDYLDGAPGVYSARFAGEEANDENNNQKLLNLLIDVPIEKRDAKFISVITMLFPNGKKIVARGECCGKIIFEPKGEGGFGYDPLFVPTGYDKTYAELTKEEKNKISHRAKALEKLEYILQEDEEAF